MDTYTRSRDRFRQQDAIAAQLRRNLKGLRKAQRDAAKLRAVTPPLTDKQREQGRGA